VRGTSQAPSARPETRLKTPRKRYGATAALMAVLALAMAFAVSASANPLEALKEYEPEGALASLNCPHSIVTGPDGNVWFGGGAEEIGRIVPGTGKVERYGTSAQPCEITVGPDGNLWFTENSLAPALGKVTPSGEVTEYSAAELGLEGNDQPPAGITAGSDGNVWFTVNNAETFEGKVGRITPSGTVTLHSLGAFTYPAHVATGSDGNLWLTGFFEAGSGIARVNTSGAMTGTFFEGLQPEAFAYDIVAGPDGNLWFTDYGPTNSVGKITTSGAITEYSSGLGTFGGGPGFSASIAAGEDGNLWVTEKGGSLARVTTGGTINTFAVAEPEFHPEGLEVEAITAGPSGEGTVWFTDVKAPKAIWSFGIEEAKVTPNLALAIEEGSGTVVSNPAGLECTGSAPKTCEKELPEGKVVLTASPAPGYLVKSWKGCDVGGVNGRQCTVTATGSLKTVGVKFYKVFSLQGSKSGGLGIMGTAPGGINCGYACTSSTALFKEGALTVKAKPAKHFHFVEFTGGTGSATSCNGVTLESCTIASFNSNSAIEEVYAEDAKNTLTLTKEGGGQGFVKTKPTNINCGLTCTAAEAEFFASETPEVTVTLGKGTSKVTWVSGAGTCTGNALVCTVPMSASHSLVAKFE
jgi:streptogramin lyase